MKITKKFLAAAILTAATFASQGGATEVQTTSYSSWLGTVSGGVSEWDFNIPSNTYNTASGYNLSIGKFGPLTVTGPDGGAYSLAKKQGYGSSNLTTLEAAGDGVGSMLFSTPAAGLTGFDLGIGESGNAAPITVMLSDGETFTLNPTVGGALLAGFSSATPITSILLSTTAGSQIELTDFLAAVSNQSAATPPPTPTAEVATGIMIGSGLLFIGARRRVFSNLTRLTA